MLEKWNFIDTGSQSAIINMAIDEMLLIWHSEGKIPPTLRFYRWSNPSLSIGHFQDVGKTIDLNGVRKHDCELVRRLTGGSAVLHDNELTYSLVISEKHPSIPTSIREAYYALSKGIVCGYNNLGIQVEYATPKKEVGLNQTAVCFEKLAYYEMVVDGKKISGNAQTRKKDVLLQHGSIPMSIDEHLLFDLFQFPSEDMRHKKRTLFSNKATSINQHTDQIHRYALIKDAFYQGFEEGLGVTFHPFRLTKAQWEEVLHLAHHKYAAESWNTNTR